jgi:hypothetical protein
MVGVGGWRQCVCCRGCFEFCLFYVCVFEVLLERTLEFVEAFREATEVWAKSQ